MTGALRCELFPSDVDASVRFYRDVLDFDLVRDEREGDEREGDAPYAALVYGAVQLGLARREQIADLGQRRPPTGVELVLEVDDLAAAHQRVLAAPWPLEEDLTDRSWGLVDFRVIDPAGYYWRITTA